MDNTNTQEWAEQIVDYALDVEKGDRVQITFQPPAKPLALAVYKKTVQRGAFPDIDLSDDQFRRAYYQNASDTMLDERVPAYKLGKADAIDKRLSIRAPTNLSETSNVDPKRQQRRQQADGMQELREKSMKETRWSLTQYPTQALAQNANMSIEAYEQFVTQACVKDWAAESRKYKELKEIIDSGETVRITTGKTDISFEIGEHNGINRVGVLSDGTSNIPGGEVFTAPVQDTIRGSIHFDLPAMVDGKEITGITLTFGENGKITDWSAEKGEDLLTSKIQTDKGSQFIGEFGIGTNFGIDRPTRDILFDEKIGGTIHLAIGRAYQDCLEPVIDTAAIKTDNLSDKQITEIVSDAKEALKDDNFDKMKHEQDEEAQRIWEQVGEQWHQHLDEREKQRNDSAVHFDMITDLRTTGTLLIDDKPILKNGTFIGVDSL